MRGRATVDNTRRTTRQGRLVLVSTLIHHLKGKTERAEPDTWFVSLACLGLAWVRLAADWVHGAGQQQQAGRQDQQFSASALQYFSVVFFEYFFYSCHFLARATRASHFARYSVAY